MKASLVLALIACLGLACGPASRLATVTPHASRVSEVQTEAPPPSVASATSTQTVAPPSPTVPPDTATAVPSTATPQLTETALASGLPPSFALIMGLGGEGQYMNPVGTPLQSWKGIPIMPDATDGQAFGSNVYSFKAKATMAQARSYYDSAHLSMAFGMTEPSTGSSGSGSAARHSVTYMLTNGLLDISGLDSDPGHVVVVIEIQ